MTLTEGFKPVVAKADKAIFVADNQPFDVTEFNVFNDLVKAFAFVIECRANIFYPLINFNAMFQAMRPKSIFLEGEVFLLRWGGNTSIRDGFSLRTCYQTSVLEILIMRVVPTIGRGTVGR